MFNVFDKVFPMYLCEGLSDGRKVVFVSILLPVLANKLQQCALKVCL